MTREGALVDRVELPAGPTATATCLMIDPPGSIEFEVVDLWMESDEPATVEVDRVFWGTVDSYLEDASEADRLIRIDTPTDGERLDTGWARITGEVWVESRVGSRGSEPQVELIFLEPGTLHHGRAEVAPIGSDDPAIEKYRFWLGSRQLAAAREQPIIARLIDHPEVRDVVTVDVRDPVIEERRELAGRIDVVPMGLEVVQSAHGPVDLVRPGFGGVENQTQVARRTTTVRGYATLDDLGTGLADNATPLIDARLHGYRGSEQGSGIAGPRTRPRRRLVAAVGRTAVGHRSG